MSDTKWTPGPWEVERGNVGAAHPLFVVTACKNLRPWCDADAHLIAAAPELYEALENLLQDGPVYDPASLAKYKERRSNVMRLVPGAFHSIGGSRCPLKSVFSLTSPSNWP